MSAAAEINPPGLHNLSKRQLAGTLTGLLLTLLLAAIDQTIVGTAMPRIIGQLNGFDRYPWVTTAYLLTSTIAVPIFAKLSDMYGRKWFFLWGTIIFVIASAFCGAAGQFGWVPGDGMTQLIVFRGVQGIGAGMILGLLFTIVGDIFAPADRAKFLGFFGAVWGLASIFGPTLGGWITDEFSWRWTFYVNLPVGALAAAAIFVEFPYFRPEGVRRKIDWWGVFTLTAGLVPLLLALTWVTDYGWASSRVIWLMLLAIGMLIWFVRIQERAEEPLLPLGLFRDPVIAVASAAVFLLGATMFGVILYIPLFMQGVLGTSAAQSGSLLTPLLLGAVLASVVSGNIIGKWGHYRIVAVVGSVVATVGMFLLAVMNGHTTNWEVVRNMVITGLGMGLMQPIYTIAVQNVAPPTQLGAATAASTFFRTIGATVGVAVFGSILLTIYHRRFESGIPPGTPDRALESFHNPLLLVQILPRLETAFGAYPGGTALLHKLMDNVRLALVDGLHAIFLVGAIMMLLSIGVNALLREVPLRRKIERTHTIE
jgi:EmrB/QacA subfamily drug resistance transporter